MDLLKLRLVVPAYNEGKMIDLCSKRVINILDDLVGKSLISEDSDVLFVDDGSVDDTWSRIERESKDNSRVKGIKLSTNLGHQVALKAGLDASVDNCDFAISIDADLQQDPSVIPDFIDAHKSGAEVVYGVRKDRKTDGVFKKITAKAFYKLAGLSGIKLVPGHADYRGLSNRALRILSHYKEKEPFLRGIIPSMGLKSDKVEFDVSEREIGESKYTLKKMFSLAMLGITSFSILPLRLFALMGGLIITLCFVMSLYVFSVAIFTDTATPGWASTLLPIYFLGGIQLFGISVLGEYVGKTFLEVKERPSYIVEREL